MNLKHLSDENLDLETVQSVKSETASTLRVLHHLREVDRRRLFSKLKYKCLVDYAERRLGYPYDQAWRRIEAMRLLKEMPELEEKISTGKLNLTSIGYARAAFKAEAKKNQALSTPEKLAFLEKIENKSTRAAQKTVVEKFGSTVLLRETVRPVTVEVSMLSIPVNDGLLEKVEKLKGLLAHSNPGITTAELFNEALDVLGEKLERAKQSKVAAPRKPSATKTADLKNTNTRYITAADNRKVWARDNSKCANCGSGYALERDHNLAFALGGKSEAENLRILCRSCNQRAAIETYGIKKMETYLRNPENLYLH